MGLDNPSIQFAAAAKAAGVDFEQTVMIGRQHLLCEPAELSRVAGALGLECDPAAFLAEHHYGEAFFELLGAQKVDSVDVSDFEQATIVHDMNEPIMANLRERFSVVYDGGTLEHVFNIPQAYKNCMEMVRVGGHFLQITVANNFLGHGFWQISPELMFRVFCEANGFAVKHVFLRENRRHGGWYRVTDPAVARKRVKLCNNSPVYVLTIAERTAAVPIFEQTPQQSDYAELWEQHETDGDLQAGHYPANVSESGRRKGLGRLLSKLLPKHLRDDPFDRDYFTRVSVEDLLRGKFG